MPCTKRVAFVSHSSCFYLSQLNVISKYRLNRTAGMCAASCAHRVYYMATEVRCVITLSSTMSSRFLIITAAVALPVVALALPYLRRPTPKPTRPPPELPAGVERRSTPEGLEILVAKPLFDLSATRSRRLAPILLLHGEFGTAMEWHRWLSYLASKGRTVYAVSLSGMSISFNLLPILCLGH